MPDDTEPYANMIAECETPLSQEKLVNVLKEMEKEMGDNELMRSKGIVMMDIDLLEYNRHRYHLNDWERPYTKTLLAMLARLAMILVLLINTSNTAFSQQTTQKKQDTELLGKAVEYYQGGKYHESILAFEKLKRHYTLTPRFLAYLGFSYYKEQQYEEATENLKKSIPHLSAYSPKERAIYIYSCAESLFYQTQYDEALKYYQMALPLTEGNDKGDILFHTAFAHYLKKTSSHTDDIQHNSIDTITKDTVTTLLAEAMALYRANTATATPLQCARLRQCERMLQGLRGKQED